MHLFHFFVDKVGWLVMQYTIPLTNALWSPKDGSTIQLCKEDGTTWLKLLARVLNHVPFFLMWENDELKVGEKDGSSVARF
jgi:hypothetical protein